MKSTINKTLGSAFMWTKKILMSNRAIRNAIMDINNNEEFTDLFEHEKMLADAVRVQAYKKGIARYIKPGDTVVDLGTGTGILSFLASRSNPSKIYAIDHSELIEIAEELAQANGITGIEFEKINSRFFNPPEKVDVILHEQIGDELFDENMVENILDLKRRVLKEGGKIIPGRFELYMEPFSFKEDFRVPFLWESHIEGIDYSVLNESSGVRQYLTRNHRIKFIYPYSVDFFLCDPSPVLTFDLNRDELNMTIPPQKKKAVRAGTMDGICIFFRALFDDEIYFDTSPLHKRTSWGNPYFRVPLRNVGAGEEISFEIDMESILHVNTWELALNPPVSEARNAAV